MTVFTHQKTHWFDVKPPVTISDFDASFFTSATELIGRNGIFGFDNEDNTSNRAVNAARDEGFSRGSMLMRAVKGLFPPYNTLITVPHYAYLKGKPWLLPLVWIHRAFRSIKNGRFKRNMKYVAASSFADKGVIEKREAIYEQWGLAHR